MFANAQIVKEARAAKKRKSANVTPYLEDDTVKVLVLLVNRKPTNTTNNLINTGQTFTCLHLVKNIHNQKSFCFFFLALLLKLFFFTSLCKQE